MKLTATAGLLLGLICGTTALAQDVDNFKSAPAGSWMCDDGDWLIAWIDASKKKPSITPPEGCEVLSEMKWGIIESIGIYPEIGPGQVQISSFLYKDGGIAKTRYFSSALQSGT